MNTQANPGQYEKNNEVLSTQLIDILNINDRLDRQLKLFNFVKLNLLSFDDVMAWNVVLTERNKVDFMTIYDDTKLESSLVETEKLDDLQTEGLVRLLAVAIFNEYDEMITQLAKVIHQRHPRQSADLCIEAGKIAKEWVSKEIESECGEVQARVNQLIEDISDLQLTHTLDLFREMDAIEARIQLPSQELKQLMNETRELVTDLYNLVRPTEVHEAA